MSWIVFYQGSPEEVSSEEVSSGDVSASTEEEPAAEEVEARKALASMKQAYLNRKNAVKNAGKITVRNMDKDSDSEVFISL